MKISVWIPGYCIIWKKKEKRKEKKDCSVHWIKYLRNKDLPSSYLNLNVWNNWNILSNSEIYKVTDTSDWAFYNLDHTTWKLKVTMTNCALTIKLLLKKNNNKKIKLNKRTTIHPCIISISIENLAIEINSTD